MPAYNTYFPAIVPPRSDDEDGRVLGTAVAGRARILATYSFADFQTPNTDVLQPGQLQIYRTAQDSFLIADTSRAADMLRTGRFPSTAGC
jgi:hypothetical protein